MEQSSSLSHIIVKYSTLILLLCYAVSATCSKKPDVKDKKAIFYPIKEDIIKTNISLSYDAKGLQPLFNLAISFMNTVQPKDFGETFKDKDIQKLFGPEWKSLIMDYELPIIIAVGVGILFVLLMPLVGCCFCMCRCCDRCGGDMKQSEKKAQQHCKVATMVFFLFIFTVLMLCGVLFMFVTNDRVHEAVRKVKPMYDDVIGEAETMANTVSNDITKLTTNQVSCITDLVETNLEDAVITSRVGLPLKTMVAGNVSGALDAATNINGDINSIAQTLDKIKAAKTSLTTKVGQLENSVTKAQSDVDQLVKDCEAAVGKGDAKCNKIKAVRDKLNIQIESKGLPNIQTYIDTMNEIKKLKLEENINKGKKIVQDIPKIVLDKSRSAITNVKTELVKTKTNIKNTGKKIADDISKTVEKYKKDAKVEVVEDETYIQWESIRWKVYVALSAVMAFIVFLLFCGLACGSCGYNKEFMPTERSATSNCGGTFLMAATGIMFIFSFILMIFCAAWFAVGMHLHVGCREMKDGKLFDKIVINQFIKDKNMQNLSVVEILTNCRKNTPLYRASSWLQEEFNITKKIDLSMLDAIENDIKGKIKFDLGDQTVLSADAKKALEDMKNSDVYNLDYDKFSTILNQAITQTDLTQVASELTTMADDMQTAGQTDMETKLRALAASVTKVETDIIPGMKSDIGALKGFVLTTLKNQLDPMQQKTTNLLASLTAANDFVTTRVVPEINKLVLDYVSPLVSYVKDGAKHILKQATDNLFKCKPVSNIYDGVVNTFMCDNLIQNANGFWLALGWCLLFFVPSIIFSVKLAKYFRKMDYSTGMDTIVVDHPPYNDKLQHHDIRAPPPYTSTQHNNPGYQHA